MNFNRSFIFFIALATHAGSVRASEVVEFYNGIRAMGMGGVGVPTVNDETAMLVNPAGLGKLRDYIITVVDPEIEGSSNAATLAGADAWNMMNPQPMLDKLNDTDNLNQWLHLKMQAFPSIVVPNFGFGAYGRYSADGRVDAANTFFEYHYLNDFAAVAAVNFRMWDGRIKLGANARVINRVQVDRTDILANSTGNTLDTLASEGMGIGSDVGLILTAPFVLLPTIAGVLRDAGGTSYSIDSGMITSSTTRPDRTAQTCDVGISIFPILGKTSRMAIGLEYRDILTASEETDHFRRGHFGIEFNLADALFIRGGMNQRYWTAGAEISMFNYQLQLASYGEEIGTDLVPQEDRRYILKFSFRF
jgi:hypothetical protein